MSSAVTTSVPAGTLLSLALSATPLADTEPAELPLARGTRGLSTQNPEVLGHGVGHVGPALGPPVGGVQAEQGGHCVLMPEQRLHSGSSPSWCGWRPVGPA